MALDRIGGGALIEGAAIIKRERGGKVAKSSNTEAPTKSEQNADMVKFKGKWIAKGDESKVSPEDEEKFLAKCAASGADPKVYPKAKAAAK